ncbi:metallo-mystery pair system four-Cys motif protein [Sphingomonas changnyeongensis]|uniref:Metallo-mystery pair system four-Cys motif protein n=1 Tax=Sphingomonas changnyeongensis TaxID=2698679 RepID=A0A7Z2S8X4_9SPHN|nr:MbnP family copper-binding protein [Sphingomonas changnyeongensis]QHL91152.1 metallo-mystery pair system four-Cys motif protein [Sphingomonas changnyeongensis]
MHFARAGVFWLAAACTVAPAMAAATQPVEIRFDARIGGEPARCGRTYAGIGTAKAGLSFQDIRLYVSAVRLIDARGREVAVTLIPDDQWQNDQVTLLDFEDRTGNCNGNAAMNVAVRGTVPAGQYRGLVFEIGVPRAINHQDPTLADAPLNVTGMTWPWRIGYKFTGIDMETSGGAAGPTAVSGFSIHLGSTACGDGPPMAAPKLACANPNRPTYRLAGFDPAKSVVVLDIAELLAGTDITVNAPKSASGCMSFPGDGDCAAIFDRLGLAWEGKASAGQRWVRAD